MFPWKNLIYDENMYNSAQMPLKNFPGNPGVEKLADWKYSETSARGVHVGAAEGMRSQILPASFFSEIGFSISTYHVDMTAYTT